MTREARRRRSSCAPTSNGKISGECVSRQSKNLEAAPAHTFIQSVAHAHIQSMAHAAGRLAQVSCCACARAPLRVCARDVRVPASKNPKFQGSKVPRFRVRGFQVRVFRTRGVSGFGVGVAGLGAPPNAGRGVEEEEGSHDLEHREKGPSRPRVVISMERLARNSAAR